MKHHLKRLEKSSIFWFLVGFSILFFFLRLPSLIEPYWYGDEGIYQTIGLALEENRTLYTGIWDNKTPLLYTLYGLVGPDQMSMRLLSLLFGIVTIPCFYFLAKNLFKRSHTALLVTFVFTVLFGLPLLEGNIANAENFMLLPIIASMFFFLFALKKNETTLSFRFFTLSGVLLGIAFLFKSVAAFDFVALLLFYFFSTSPPKLSRSSLITYFQRNKFVLGLFIGGFFLPFALSVLYFFFRGSLSAYIMAAFFGNVDYVGFQNTAIILLVKIILAGLGMFLLFKKRHEITSPVLFIGIWFIMSLFNSFFTNRPYTHYLLVLLPSFSLLTGLLFTRNKRQKTMVLGVLVATTILTLSFFQNWSLLKSFQYYGNFSSYITGEKSTRDYASFFDPRTPRDHDIAAYLKKQLQPDDTVFFWGDNAQMYYLTGTLPPGRYTVAYHITHAKDALEETQKAFENAQPEYVVIFPEVSQFPYPMYNYQQRLSIQGALIYERLY